VNHVASALAKQDGEAAINSELAAGIIGGLVGGVSGSVATLIGSAYLSRRHRKRELRVRLYEKLVPEALAECPSDRNYPREELMEALETLQRVAVMTGAKEHSFVRRALTMAAERQNYYDTQPWGRDQFGDDVWRGDHDRLQQLHMAIRKQLEAFQDYLAGKLD
jgi:hypothetical protein